MRGLDFPRAPVPWLAVILAPAVWQLGRPDLFDAFRYSCVIDMNSDGFDSLGMILMQMSVPQLRTAASMVSFATSDEPKPSV